MLDLFCVLSKENYSFPRSAKYSLRRCVSRSLNGIGHVNIKKGQAKCSTFFVFYLRE